MLYAYDAQDVEELSFVLGEVLEILKECKILSLAKGTCWKTTWGQNAICV